MLDVSMNELKKDIERNNKILKGINDSNDKKIKEINKNVKGGFFRNLFNI